MPSLAAAIRKCIRIKTLGLCSAFICDLKLAPELNSCLVGEVVCVLAKTQSTCSLLLLLLS